MEQNAAWLTEALDEARRCSSDAEGGNNVELALKIAMVQALRGIARALQDCSGHLEKMVSRTEGIRDVLSEIRNRLPNNR